MKRFILLLILYATILLPSASTMSAEREAFFVPGLVKVRAEQEIDSLKDIGVEILRRRGDILLCLFPDASTRSTGSLPHRSRHIVPTLDVAKTYFGAGSVQSGAAGGTPYTGKGVVVGLCDIGIDPLHPTFLGADGRSRIKRVVHYVEHEGTRFQLDGDDDYRRWRTDNPEMYHATHVCGILAGGGTETAYSGIAPDAEIVATVSTLTEVGLLAGVEDIIDYAKEVGKPAVINISVGSYTGPHDGTSLFSQYLDMCADDAVIVMSSGNEGSHKNTLMQSFIPGRTSVAFRLGNKAWDQYCMYGVTDIWSGTSSPLSVSLGVYDSDTKEVSGWMPLDIGREGTLTLHWDGADTSPDDFPFRGELMATAYVDEENGRHCVSLGYEFTSPETASAGGWARYVLALEVTGEPGDDVEVYADGVYTRLIGLSGNPAPSSERTVSDLACGFNIISVGMYGNRDSVPLSNTDDPEDESIYLSPTGFECGGTVEYSSYGTLRDGRMLPLTVAPGASLMSAGSRIYLENHPSHPHLRAGGATWLEVSGTSMSSPYVAGYIATWLEAVPTLTSDDIRRIIVRSNRTDIAEPGDPRNASGYFDPVAGLKLALHDAGVEFLPESFWNPDECVEVYDVVGVKRYAGVSSGLSGMKKGLYVVRGSGGSTRKVMVK